MGWACGTYGKEEKSIVSSCRKLKERHLGVNCRIIFKWILKKLDGMAWPGFISHDRYKG